MRIPTNEDVWDFVSRYAVITVIGGVALFWFAGTIHHMMEPQPVYCSLDRINPGSVVTIEGETWTVDRANVYESLGEAEIRLIKN